MSHPSIRIATLIAFAVLLGTGGLAVAALATSCALILNLACGSATRVALARLFWRARFLLVAVACLNAWGVPGAPAWDAAPWWAPSHAGIELAAHRITALAAMLAAVNAVLSRTSGAALAAGIAWLAVPLRGLGAEPERLAARLSGTLTRIAATESALREPQRAGGWRGALTGAVLDIERSAEAAAPTAVTVLAPPSPLAWAAPLALLAAAAVLGSR